MASPLRRPAAHSLTTAGAIFIALAAGRTAGAAQVPDTFYNPLARGSPAPPGVGMVNAWQEKRIGIENRYSRSQSAIDQGSQGAGADFFRAGGPFWTAFRSVLDHVPHDSRTNDRTSHGARTVSGRTPGQAHPSPGFRRPGSASFFRVWEAVRTDL